MRVNPVGNRMPLQLWYTYLIGKTLIQSMTIEKFLKLRRGASLEK